jgi:hypothetical protein
MTENENERQKVIDYCKTMLGDGMIDVELDPVHYNTAIDRALNKFRQRSSNAVEESYAFLTVEVDKNDLLATYYAFASYQKQVGKMFGSEINFTYNKTTKKLTLMQRPRSEEEVLLWVYNYRPDFNLLQDPFANQWLKDYSLATCKSMLGEAREKFNQIASPQGGTALNGTALKGEGKAEMEMLELDLVNYKDGGTPLTFVIG